MKKLLISLAIVLGISALFGVTITHADGTQFWKLVNGSLVPVSSWSIGGTGVNGTLNTLTVTSCSGCGSGGGGSSTLIYAGNGIFVNASGTNGYIITNGGVTSTATGTAFYFPYWNAAGTALTATSSLSQNASGTITITNSSPSSADLSVNGNTDNLASFEGSSTIAWDYNDYLNAVSNLTFGTASTSLQISTTTGLAQIGRASCRERV